MEETIVMVIVACQLAIFLGLQIQLRNIDQKFHEMLKKPDNHLICLVCGAVKSIKLDVDKSLIPTEKLQQDFEINGIYVDFYGVCHKCKNKL